MNLDISPHLSKNCILYPIVNRIEKRLYKRIQIWRKIMKSCCFTGHRDFTKETAIALAESFIPKMEVLVTEGFVPFYAGGAWGDFLAEQAV